MEDWLGHLHVEWTGVLLTSSDSVPNPAAQVCDGEDGCEWERVQGRQLQEECVQETGSTGDQGFTHCYQVWYYLITTTFSANKTIDSGITTPTCYYRNWVKQTSVDFCDISNLYLLILDYHSISVYLFILKIFLWLDRHILQTSLDKIMKFNKFYLQTCQQLSICWSEEDGSVGLGIRRISHHQNSCSRL